MIRHLRKYYYLLLPALILSGCQKKFNDFYERPENLGPPIYQQLESKGNFKHLLSAIDKAGYKDILGQTGWWTFFAPTDAAFEEFYQQNNISGEDGLSDSLATSIVKYLLVYNSYREDQLSTYQSSEGLEAGAGLAFKRKTAYYDWVQQKGDDVHGKVIATNRNLSTRKNGSTVTSIFNYKDGDNNNKYIPYFTDLFMSSNGLYPEDYETFYPGTSFSGFNVAGAAVDATDRNMAAENGMIHVIDKVITPLPNIDQYIHSKPEYSEFAKLLDSLRYYSANAYVTQTNQIATGSADSVYVKGYDGQLAFSPNNENYQVPGLSAFFNTESQKQSWTIMVPTNAAMNQYRQAILGKYNNSFFGQTPATVLIDFMNSQMWSTALWPSQFKTTENYLLESTTLELTNAVDKKILSNGIFYGVNQVNRANVFRTVFGVPYLDPATKMTLYAFNDLTTGIKSYTVQPGVRQTILVMPDEVLAAAGWRYNESSAGASTTPWGYKAPTSSSYNHNTIRRENILRMFSTGILLTPTMEMSSFGGQGIIETKSGDYIKYNNGKIITSGTQDAGVDLNVTGSDMSSVNGNVFYVDGLLSFTENNVGQQLEDLAAQYPNDYGSFFWFVSKGGATVYNTTTKAIAGVNTGLDNKYTIFAPNNAAISQAIRDGLLPGNASTGALPTSSSFNVVQQEQIRQFVLYHIINGESVASDGKKTDSYITMLQKEDGNPTLVSVSNDPGNLVVTDATLNAATVNESVSNQLGNRALIHSINNYLKSK